MVCTFAHVETLSTNISSKNVLLSFTVVVSVSRPIMPVDGVSMATFAVVFLTPVLPQLE